MKNAIMQENGSIVNMLFYYYYILRESDSLNLATTHPWSLNCLENFRVLMLFMRVSNCWKIVEFPKISIKAKKF